MRNWKTLLPLLALAALLAGCSAEPEDASVYTGAVVLEELELEDEAVPLAAGPAAQSDLLLPEASGVKEKKNSKAVIDYSNITDGYVMVRYTATTSKRLKVKLVSPSGANDYYQYNLTPGQWATFPLSDGNGEYKVSVMENTTGSKYASVLSVSFTVTLDDEFAPFLRPNQYVNYADAKNTIAKAKELIGSETDALKKVEKVYDFVVANLTYDKAKAQSVQSGYLPVLDDVLAQKKGICFDYAALMTAMLRSQGVPCKLVVGYAGEAYHAWINVWSEENGWIDGAVFFDGQSWQRMDPTFASSGGGSDAIMKYIGDGSNYVMKYLY